MFSELSTAEPKTRQFTHINEGFTCENCKKAVQALPSGCRNHCPFCLHSKHVDYMPGDRKNPCEGMMAPISYEIAAKGKIVLSFQCKKCGFKGRNKAAHESSLQADDFDEILSLSFRLK